MAHVVTHALSLPSSWASLAEEWATVEGSEEEAASAVVEVVVVALLQGRAQMERAHREQLPPMETESAQVIELIEDYNSSFSCESRAVLGEWRGDADL